MTRRRKLLLALLPLLVLLAIGEGVARMALPPSPAQGLDRDLLWEVEPGPQNLHATQTTVNALGLRGPEIVQPKPDGTRRLFSLGDSSVFGFGIQDGKVFTDVAARSLGMEPVIGAMPGYSSLQARAVLDRQGDAVEPDIVVIATLWSDNNFDGFVDEELKASRSGAGAAVAGLFAQSGLFRAGSMALGVQAHNEVGFGTLAQNPRLGRRRVALQDYVANLEALVETTVSLGGEPIFLMLANEVDVAAVEGYRAWEPYREAMRQVAARHGCPLVEAAPMFAGRRGVLLDRMHPSEQGHRLLGDAVASAVRKQGWPSSALCSGGTGEPARVWDPYVDAGPPEGLVDDAPRLTGVTWFGGAAKELTLTATVDGREISERMPPKAPFALKLGGDRVHLSAELVDRAGGTHAVDFGDFDLPARGVVLDFDDHIDPTSLPEVLMHAPK